MNITQNISANTQKQIVQSVQKNAGALGGFSLINTATFHIRTLDDAAKLSQFAAMIFKDPDRIRPGLYELMLNAIEHGCLGVGHDLKGRLLGNRTWQAEIDRRLSLPENRQKSVSVVIARKQDGIYTIITDPGTGFDWQSWKSIDPAHANLPHGHGLARARGISFDKIIHNKEGNQAIAYSKDVIDIKW